MNSPKFHDGFKLDLAAAQQLPNFDLLCIMDATCGLCAKMATRVAHNDRAQRYQILPIQSEQGQAIARHFGIDPNDPSSWILLTQDKARFGIKAFIEVGKDFGGIWSLFRILEILPSSWQQALYRTIATNRYRLFGRTDLCTLPDREVQWRLVKT